MNETYGIELKLILDKFKQKIEQVKNSFKGIEDQKIDIGKQARIDNLKRQLEIAKNEANLLGNRLDRLSEKMENMPEWKLENPETEKLLNDIERTDIKFDKAIAKVDTLNDKLKALESTSNKAGDKLKETGKKANFDFNKMSSGWDKVTSKIKKFAFSLIGIRTIFSLVSRASSAYLSQDTELANKLQAVWIGLGALLEPIINWIADALIRLVKYINIFVKALTGVDLLAKATAKSLNKTNKSAKALSKTLAGFDELTNLDTDSAGGGGADAGWADAFNKVQIDENIAKIIENIGTKIKEAWEWFTDNWQNIVLGIVGVVGAFALLGMIKGLFSPIETATQVFGGFFNKLGKGIQAIAILGGLALVINQVAHFLDVFSKSGLEVRDVVALMSTVFLTVVGLMAAVALLGPAMTSGLIPFSVVIVGISALLIVMAETLPKILDACAKFINNVAPSIESILQTIGNLIKDIIYALGTALPPIINAIGNVFDKIFRGISLVILSVGNVIVDIMNTAKSLITDVLSAILNFINQLGPAINNFVDNAIIAVTKLINFLISGIEYLVNTLIINAVNGVINALNNIPFVNLPKLPKVKINRFVPSYDVGTNYVPEDQLAYIHKGEAVIPKKFNSQEYFGGNNEETNSLLERVLEAIDRIDINPYTTIRDVGQASEDYFKQKERRTGRQVFA